MELQTKFIESTNEQYSIREDGVVISNYINHFSGITKSVTKKYRVKELKPNKDGKVCFQIGGRNGLRMSLTLSVLMKEYYNGVKCHRCDNMITKKYSQVCEYCANKLIKDASKKWMLNNPHKVKEHQKNKLELLPKHYVANLLGIKSNEITDELYNHHKKLMLFKREICEEHDIKMQKLTRV